MCIGCNDQSSQLMERNQLGNCLQRQGRVLSKSCLT